MQIHRDLFRQADFIEQSLNNLLTAFLEGAALVILVVVVFLMNVRAAVITLLALPLSLVAAVRSFLPEFNEGALTVSAVTIPGTSLADSNALGNALERLMLSVPEVTSTARRTGRAELDEHVQGVESAGIDVRLVMKDRPREAVLEEHLATEQQTDIPTLKVRVDAAAAARQGLATGTVAEALQTARVGHAVGQILEGQIAFPLVVRYAIDHTTDLESIGTTQTSCADFDDGVGGRPAARADCTICR